MELKGSPCEGQPGTRTPLPDAQCSRTVLTLLITELTSELVGLTSELVGLTSELVGLTSELVGLSTARLGGDGKKKKN